MLIYDFICCWQQKCFNAPMWGLHMTLAFHIKMWSVKCQSKWSNEFLFLSWWAAANILSCPWLNNSGFVRSIISKTRQVKWSPKNILTLRSFQLLRLISALRTESKFQIHLLGLWKFALDEFLTLGFFTIIRSELHFWIKVSNPFSCMGVYKEILYNSWDCTVGAFSAEIAWSPLQFYSFFHVWNLGQLSCFFFWQVCPLCTSRVICKREVHSGVHQRDLSVKHRRAIITWSHFLGRCNFSFTFGEVDKL